MKQFYILALLMALLLPANAQLNESFEGASFPPDGWTIINEGGSNTWESFATGQTGKCTRIKYNTDAHNDWLITPQITIKENGQLTLFAKNHSSSWLDQFHIKLSTSGNTQADFTVDIASNVEPGTAWEELSYDLSAYTGQQVYIAFQAISSNMYYLYLDDIKIFAPAPMTVNGTSASQPNTDVASIGASNLDILQINVKTTGSLTTESATQFTFSTNGTTDAANIEKASLYYCASSAEFSTTTLFGEVNTPNGEFTITGSQELSEGDNYFWLAYDIASAAAANNIIDAECKSVTAASTAHTPDVTAPEGNRLLSKILNIQSGVNSYTVNGSVAFYDDGGKEAKYTEGFEGTITFTPATQGQKIKIEWNSFEIFNTSSTGKNDIFKIYNGSVIDENKLVGQYSNVPPPITSMADDGSLTIYFNVKTGVPKAGWDALVKEITPQNMVFDAVLMYQMNFNNVAAADKNQEIALIEVSTKNTENHLKAESFSLALTGTTTPDDISKAKIYYTGGTLEFSTDKLFGEIENPTTNYSITGSQDLVEGSNYFWLVYDISNTAIEANILDAEVKSITVSGTNHNLETTVADGHRPIDNTYFMPESGTHTKNIYAPLSFVDDGGETSNYGNMTMSTVTFVPATPGEVMKIDFDTFDVLYQASASGTKAFFKIYNGSGTANTDIIWAADETNCSQGPAGIITSTATDGSLTIKFVANAYSSAQVKAGWNAQLWSAIPSDMEYHSAEVTQTTEIVKAGSFNQEILHVALTMAGTLNPVNAIDFTFNTQGSTTTSDITEARLYSTGFSSTFSTDTQSGDAVITPNGEFSISHTSELQEGLNHFWLVYDIASDATVENAVDASLNKITIGATEYSIANGNPDGSRTIKRLLELQSGINEVIVGENPLAFYDDGGLTANYSKGFEGTVTFVPETAGQRVRIDLSSLQITWAEDIIIYNGADATDENKMLELDDNNNITTAQSPIIIKSTSPDGKLTFKFKSGSYSTPEAGFEASVYAFEPQPYAYLTANAEQGINAALRGEANVTMLRIPAHFAGETTAATINAITFSTAGTTTTSDIASAQIYYTGTDAIFNPISAIPYGELQTSPSGLVKVNGSQDVSVEGTVYFWLMYNVSPEAVVDNVLDAQLTAIEVNSIEHIISEGNPTGDASIKAGRSGNYTIGSSADDDYTNFTEAFADIASNGVESSVTVIVKDGTYTERPSLPHIKGASANNTITFTSESGNAASVIIESNVAASTDYNAPDDAVLYINGADYVTFKGMTFKSSQKQYDALVLINNQSRHVTFDACVFDAPVEAINTSYSAIDIACIKNEAENVANKNNDYLTIRNCRLLGGEIGAYIGGTGYVKLPKEVGAQLINNTFEGQFSKGLYLNNEKDAVVKGNKIQNNTSPYSSFNAIDAYRVTGSSVIANNSITLERTNKSNGIQCRPVSGTTTTPARVYNNLIAFVQSPSSSYGILLDDKCENTEFYHNTVLLQGAESTNSSAIYITGTSSEVPAIIKVRNNIFINKTGGSSIKVQRDEFMAGLTFDYNDIYSSGTNIAAIASTNHVDLAAWQGKVTAAHSISENVEFYSSTDLHVKVLGNLNSALPIDYITEDFEGQIRSTTTSTIGADEFTEPDLTAPVLNEGYPKVDAITYNSATLMLSLNEAGNAYWIILPAAANAPSSEQVKAGTDTNDITLADNLKGNFSFTADAEASTIIESLDDNSDYTVYLSIEDNLGNVMANVASVSFTTDFKPTEVATFEAVQAMAPGIFSDGTATFMNVTVTDGEGIKSSTKYGVIEANRQATISLTNTAEGLTLEGFFYQSATDFIVKGGQNGGTFTAELTIPASETWSYADLSALNKVIAVYITAGTNDVQIDNFADVPMDLQIISLYDVSINRGESTDLVVELTGGVKPYFYSWSSANDNTVYTNAQPSVSPQSSCEYKLVVTDNRGNSLAERLVVNVNGDKALAATFEGLLTQDESHWMGDPEQDMSNFYSGSFKFNNYYFPDYDTWGNFGYSNETSTTYNNLEDQFHSAAGHGANDSKTYGVVYVFGSNPEIVLTNTQEGEELSGCYLTNTAYAVNSMVNGDAFAGDPFTNGDWFKLTITGVDKDEAETGRIDFYLADFRSSNPVDHFILKEWKWVDLSSLGAVQKLSFSIDGSRENAYGLLTPGYVCIDDLNGVKQSSPTSIDKTYQEVKLYPNPTNGIVHIKMSNNEKAKSVEVYDITGKKVKSTTGESQTINQVDISELNRGTYIIRIISDSNSITRKIQKF